MKDRIRLLRKELGLNQTDFGERIGVKQAAIAGYESGIRTPLDAVVNSICREFCVNEDWLRNGTGEMFKEKLPEDEVASYVEELLEDDGNPFFEIIIGMMKAYHQMDETSRQAALEFFRRLKENLEK